MGGATYLHSLWNEHEPDGVRLQSSLSDLSSISGFRLVLVHRPHTVFATLIQRVIHVQTEGKVDCLTPVLDL
jgi:hypothetical protein